MGQAIVFDLKNDCFRSFLRSDIEFHDKENSGELVSHLTNDLEYAKTAASGNLTTLIRNSILCLGNICFLINISFKLSLIIVFLTPLFLLSSYTYGSYCKTISKQYQKFVAKISAVA